jgi:citrate synthase
MHHTYVHSQLENQMSCFRYDAHPFPMIISTIASLSTFHPEANPCLVSDSMYMKPKVLPGKLMDKEEREQAARADSVRQKAIFRMLGKVTTISAHAYRHRQGRPFNTPMATLNYVEHILYMMGTQSPELRQT